MVIRVNVTTKGYDVSPSVAPAFQVGTRPATDQGVLATEQEVTSRISDVSELLDIE